MHTIPTLTVIIEVAGSITGPGHTHVQYFCQSEYALISHLASSELIAHQKMPY